MTSRFIGGLGAAVLALGSTACAVRLPPAGPEAPGRPADRAPIASPSAAATALTTQQRAELEQLERQLAAELAAVEQQLLGIRAEKQAERWEQLVERRLWITVALWRVERALALGVPLVHTAERGVAAANEQTVSLLPPSEGISGETSATPVERALADAARRVARAREYRLAEDQTGAAEGGEGRNYQQRTAYDFEDDVVDGDLLRPGSSSPGAAPTTRAPAAKAPRPVATPPAQPIDFLDIPKVPPDGSTARKAAVVSPTAPPAGVMPVVRRHLSPLLECFPEHLRDGDVRLRVRTMLGADGTLREPRVEADTTLPPTVVGCVTELFAQMRVPPPEGGARIIVIPLRLR